MHKTWARGRLLLLLLPVVAAVPGPAQAGLAPALAYAALFNVKDGTCLDPDGTLAGSRTNVRLAACDGLPDQRWAFKAVPGESGWFEVINEKSGLCLDVQGYDAAEGSNVMMYACDKNPDQWWKQVADGGKVKLQNKEGGFYTTTTTTTFPFTKVEWHDICLDPDGHSGDVGTNVSARRCDGYADQLFVLKATGTTPTLVTSSSGSKSLCATPSGPCVGAAWTGTAPTYSATGAFTLAQLPVAGISLGGNGSLGLNAGTEFALVGSATLQAGLGTGVTATLPQAQVAIGYGAGISAVLQAQGKGPFSIGGSPYRLEPSALYAYASFTSEASITLGGMTITMPAKQTAGLKPSEVFVGMESQGPSLYLAGAGTLPLPTPPSPPVVTISEATVGWFGTRKLPYTLSTPLLARSAPVTVDSLSVAKETVTVDATLLVGGAASFAGLDMVTFNGTLAIDPDATTDTTSLTNLSKAVVAVEGGATLELGTFSLALGNAAAVYDAGARRLDLAANLPVGGLFDAIDSTYADPMSGNVYAAGRFGSGLTNLLVVDFSDAKLFGFDLGSFRGLVNFSEKSVAVSGKLKLGTANVTVGGKLSPTSLAVNGSTSLELDGVALASSSLAISTSGVRVRGRFSFAGKSWSFDQTMKTPSTIKSPPLSLSVTIPTVATLSTSTWAQYTMGGTLSVKSKASASIAGKDWSETSTVSSDGTAKFTILGVTHTVKVIPD